MTPTLSLHAQFTDSIAHQALTMASNIPTSTSVWESAIIDAPLAQVWHLIKLQDFSRFWTQLKSSEFVKGASSDTDIVRWGFKDGTVLEVKQEEHSVSFEFSPPPPSSSTSTSHAVDLGNQISS
jgi:hypothetical protein